MLRVAELLSYDVSMDSGRGSGRERGRETPRQAIRCRTVADRTATISFPVLDLVNLSKLMTVMEGVTAEQSGLVRSSVGLFRKVLVTRIADYSTWISNESLCSPRFF